MEISPFFLSLPHFLSQEMDREGATAAVSLWPWISAIPCTWARLTLHVYIALKWVSWQRVGWWCWWGGATYPILCHLMYSVHFNNLNFNRITEEYCQFHCLQLCIWHTENALEGSRCQNSTMSTEEHFSESALNSVLGRQSECDTDVDKREYSHKSSRMWFRSHAMFWQQSGFLDS